jgi:hypothetical protein
MRRFDRLHPCSTSCIQADNCNDLLHLQPMMAGPYQAAQSPEPFPIPSIRSALLGLPSALSVTASPLSRFTPAHFLTSQSPRSLQAAPPPSNGRTLRSQFFSPIYDTSHLQAHSPIGGGCDERHSVPILAECRLPEITIQHRTGSPQTAPDLSVLHPPCRAAPTNRRSPPPSLSGSQPLICSYASQSPHYPDIILVDVT